MKWAAHVTPEPTSRETDSMYVQMNAIVASILDGYRVSGDHPQGDIPGHLPAYQGRGWGRGHMGGRESQRGWGARGRGV